LIFFLSFLYAVTHHHPDHSSSTGSSGMHASRKQQQQQQPEAAAAERQPQQGRVKRGLFHASLPAAVYSAPHHPWCQAHVKGVAAEQLSRGADANVGQQHQVASGQLVLDGAALHKPHLAHLACREWRQAHVACHGYINSGSACNPQQAKAACRKRKGLR
jgi:hypothetical protein